MRKDKQKLRVSFSQGLNSAAVWTLRIVGSVIFCTLSWYALRYTQYIPQFQTEIPVNMHDSVSGNILVLGLAMFGMVGLSALEQHLSVRVQTWVMRSMIVALALWVGICGIIWITSVDRQPVGDQAFIYGGASYFIEGQYSFLEKNGYCDMWPHQLGLIAVVELLFRFVGTYNYFALQIISVGFTVGISILGYLLVRFMSDNMAVVLAYCILMSACLPMFFYTGWVYGDIPSTFFMMATAYLLLKYKRSGNWRYLPFMILAVVMAILVRKNSLIMLIALCLTAGVYVILHRDKKLFLALVLSALLPGLVYAGIYKMYEVRSGTKILGGIPAASYFALGMQESTSGNGWFTEYHKKVYWASDSDPKLAAEVSWQDVKTRWEVFKNDPSYAWQFYREKVLSQWNQPLYQSLFFSAQYKEGMEPDPDSLDAKIHGQYLSTVLTICDRIQFIIYFGMMCYFLFAVKKGSNILQHMLAATMIGGFFFSIIWEAKARYVLPYYIIMYPMAVLGYGQLFQFVALVSKRLHGKKFKTPILSSMAESNKRGMGV